MTNFEQEDIFIQKCSYNIYNLIFILSLDNSVERDVAECLRTSKNGKMCNCDVPLGFTGFAECEQNTVTDAGKLSDSILIE